MTIRQLRTAKENGIALTVLEARLRYGWTVEEAIHIPKQHHRRWGSISREKRAAGLSLTRVYQRLHHGWPLAKALSTPPRAYRRAS